MIRNFKFKTIGNGIANPLYQFSSNGLSKAYEKK